MWLERSEESGSPPPRNSKILTTVICVGLNVGANAFARLLLRDTSSPGWLTLLIDGGLALFFWLGEMWARTLFMVRILLGLTAWPGWLYGKDFFSLAVNGMSDFSYLLALWGSQHHRLRYLAYTLSVSAAALVMCDAL